MLINSFNSDCNSETEPAVTATSGSFILSRMRSQVSVSDDRFLAHAISSFFNHSLCLSEYARLHAASVPERITKMRVKGSPAESKSLTWVAVLSVTTAQQ
jgi:hypothetical protein